MGELRRDFASRLKRRCKTFPALLAGYAQTLCERGLGIEEVEGELENAWSKIRSEAKKWTALAYDGELRAPDWRAPCYLAGFPSLATTQKHIPIAMMHGRLDANETKRIIAAVQSSIQEHHDVNLRRCAEPLPQFDQRSGPSRCFRHGKDFVWVEGAEGERINLTPRQSQVFTMLAEVGEPFELPHVHILAKLNTPDSSLRDTFRRCKLWKTLIVSDSKKRTVRLSSPPIQNAALRGR
jgi:hypothetical protein